MWEKEFFLVRLAAFHQSFLSFDKLHSQVHWATLDQEGGNNAKRNTLTKGTRTGPLLWLCTVKSGQKSRSARARSSDSASGRAPSSSSSSSVCKDWHIVCIRLDEEYLLSTVHWKKWVISWTHTQLNLPCSITFPALQGKIRTYLLELDQLEWGNTFF